MSACVIHSLVHLTYNNVMHRMLAFATSNGVLAVILIAYSWALFNKSYRRIQVIQGRRRTGAALTPTLGIKMDLSISPEK